jgi:superfamily II DNA or RNA helicase
LAGLNTDLYKKGWKVIFHELNKKSEFEKGKIFEELTYLALTTKSTYTSILKNVWIHGKGMPSAIQTKLNLPKTDEGIDLVAETYSGEFWAIQCKFKGKNQSPTYKELSTFTHLAHSHCKHISTALLVHTGERGVKKKGLLGNKYSEIGLEFWLELTDEDWLRIWSKKVKKPAKPQKRLPKPHQKKAIGDAHKHFIKDAQSRGKLIMPCGTGKSLTAFWIANKLNALSIIVAVPSLNLIKQSLEDWTREFEAIGEKYRPAWKIICSDKSVSSIENDEFVTDVASLGVPTTDLKDLTHFLKQETKGKKIVFTTYQSSQILAKAARKTKFRFDFAILDEAHKTVGEKFKSFATLLSDRNIQIKKRMFMTATERVLKGKNDDVHSMDDVSVYGERFYQLTFKAAIQAKPNIISDYKILTIAVSDSQIKELVQKNRLLSDKKGKINDQEAQSLAAAIALRQATRQYGIKHAISFHKSIKAAEKFTELNQHLNNQKANRINLSSFHISSKKATGERSKLIEDFKSEPLALMTNARCLTEGVNIPAIDCVLFADPKQSTVDIVQAAGRALRVSEGKKFGYIMMPLIVPDNMDILEFSKSTPFKQVAKIVASLSTQDERIIEELRLKHEDKKLSDRILEISGSFSDGIKFDISEFSDSIHSFIWEKVGRANWRSFEDARVYVRTLKIHGYYEWLDSYKTGIVPKDIPMYPDKVYHGSGWISWPDWLGNLSTEDKFNIGILKLKEFISEHGNSYVPETFVTKDGFNLGQFCKMARQGTIKIKERRKILSSIKGWVWDIEEDKFNKLYKALSDFSKKNKGIPAKRIGNEKVQIGSTVLDLGSWVFTLRNFYKKLKNGSLKPTVNKRLFKSLDDPRIKLIEKIPFWEWSVKKKMLPFDKARKFIQKLKLQTRRDYCNWWDNNANLLDFDLPKKPEKTYAKSGWKDWPDFLGSSVLSNWDKSKNIFSYSQAKHFLKIDCKGMIKSMGMFDRWKNGKLSLSGLPSFPVRMPRAPINAYTRAGDWVDNYDFFGYALNKRKKKSARPDLKFKKISYKDLRAIVRKENVNTRLEYSAWLKKNKKKFTDKGMYAPFKPESYGQEFEGWAIFLNSTNQRSIAKSRK